MSKQIFSRGTEGYHAFRIPSLIMTPSQTLLAICEGRRDSLSDHGHIDLLMRSSKDRGETWSDLQVICSEEEKDCTIGNPCPVVDEVAKQIVLPYCRNNIDAFILTSSDDGATWSTPREITASARKKEWDWLASGPGIGIQLKSKTHAGRLVIPFDHHDPEYGDGSHAVYSDDHGKSWQCSEAIFPGANECQVVELKDGRLLMNMRMQSHGRGFRTQSISDDGGATWSELTHVEALPCHVCQASLLNLGDQMLFCNPSPDDLNSCEAGRGDLKLRISRDEGNHWELVKMIHEGPGAYSCMAADDDALYLVYEGGRDFRYEHIHFDRIPLTEI